jgi:hypothetical protein
MSWFLGCPQPPADCGHVRIHSASGPAFKMVREKDIIIVRGIQIHGGSFVSRNTRIALGLSSVLSVYMIYLFWAWSVFKSWGTITFYVVPFFNFSQPGESFLSWINRIVFITLVLWIVWMVLFIKDNKRS